MTLSYRKASYYEGVPDSVDYDPEERSPVRFEKYGQVTERYDDEEGIKKTFQ